MRNATKMTLTERQKITIEQVVNAFEGSSPDGNYGAIATADDGPFDTKQISYGKAQATEFSKTDVDSNLKRLILHYCKINGQYKNQFLTYLDKIGVIPLVNDAAFKKLLRDAAKFDLKMRTAQDYFFDQNYFNPAKRWADAEGFILPLSMLVVYDSYIQSGRVLQTIRNRFAESTPRKGGNEKQWIQAYVSARRGWLASRSNEIVQRTVYRMDCFNQLIAADNWHLLQFPIYAHGVVIRG
jgi:chitosanase